MKTRYNSSNYGNDLRLTLKDANLCTHPGDCENDVKGIMNKPYIKKQLAALDKDQLKKELGEYGAWDDEELNDHEQNLVRWVWLSAGDISEEAFMKG